MPWTPKERTELGKIGAAARLANEDPAEMTAAARCRMNGTGPGSKWYDQTDPSLDPRERERRAQALRDGHMARMRLARSKARSRAAEATADADRLDAELRQAEQ